MHKSRVFPCDTGNSMY